ncbi:YbaK/EbsC family protein [Companilactobacillus ginsenosidimutans]|uniref:YbaK/EbsC family protein n=1 Tax=Companilactobacillus ginsenosidimutans TaxID=1007676 RepID=UPI00065F957F|nr:YbaK/EbsC family protein [Companilactobacillus ginsenosidimutans]
MGDISEVNPYCTPVKNLLLFDKKREFYYLVLEPANVKLDFKKLAEQMNTSRSSLGFASDEQLASLLDTETGFVSPLILKSDLELKVLVNPDLLSELQLGFHAGSNTETAVINSWDLGLFLGKIGYYPILLKI